MVRFIKWVVEESDEQLQILENLATKVIPGMAEGHGLAL